MERRASLLPTAAAGRLSLRALQHSLFEAKAAVLDARIAVDPFSGDVADRSLGDVETIGRRGSDTSHTIAAGCNHRPSLRLAVRDQPSVASLVFTDSPRRDSLSPLRAL